MKQVGRAISILAFLVGTLAANAQTPSWLPPPDNERCPSKWGAGDERGAVNHVKPQSVLNALKLVKTGEIIELAHVLNANMPFSGTRRFDVHVKVPNPVPGANNRVTNEEMVLSEIGQVGTQFDGFTHQSHAGSHYNCFKTSEIVTRTGFTKLGIQNVGTLIARGVLIDVAGYKGVETLPDNYEITVEDIEGAVKKQSITFQPGDAILIHTGWGRLWGKENARYSQELPRARREGRAMADRQGPAAARRRQFPGRGRAQSRALAQSAGAPARAGGARGASAGEPQARRARRQERQRVRPGPAADEDAGRDRLDRGADRVAVKILTGCGAR